MKFVKKLTALFLAIVMTMALGITAFAKTEATDTTLKINTTDGHTYKVYQVLQGAYDEKSGKLSDAQVGSSVTAEGATVESITTAVTGKSEGELGNAAYALVKNGTVYTTVEGDGTAKSVTVKTGYYVITDEYTSGTGTDSISRYLVTVAGPTEVTPKTETPSIDKKIIDTDNNAALDDSKKTDTAAIGDEIEFEVTGKVPNTEGYDYYYYILNDTLSKGLTLKADSFVVTIEGVEQPLTQGDGTAANAGDYNVYVTDNTFKLAFTNISGYTAGKAISIKYKATVNKDAEISGTPNTNTAYLTYSNNPNTDYDGTKNPNKPGLPDESKTTPTGETPKYETKTYVTELKLTKVDSVTKQALQGAEFTLTGGNLKQVVVKTEDVFTADATVTEGHYYKLADGTYTEKAPSADSKDGNGNITYGTWRDYADVNKDKTEKNEAGLVTEVAATVSYTRTAKTTVLNEDMKATNVKATVNADGIITFTGLNYGTYTLTESKTPDGYSTIDPIQFTISRTLDADSSSESTGGTVTWASSNEKVTTNGNTFAITVENVPGSVLPTTGGMGTAVIYVAGIAMIVVAGIVVIARKRMA